MSGPALAVLGWLALAAGFTAVALVKLSLRRRPTVGTPRPVLLLRPVDAPTPEELALLATPLPPHVRQVVLSPYRPRLPAHVEWCPSDPLTANRKVGHLSWALATLDLEDRAVVALDADVRADAALVDALAGPLADARVALTTAAPWPVDVRGVGGSALRGLLAHSHQSFDVIDAMRAGAPAVCGKALGLGAAAQEELPRLGAFIGEDLELASRLHARGHRVVTVPVRAETPRATPLALDEVVDRLTRWMQVLRAHRPGLAWTVPVLFAASPLLLVLAPAVLGEGAFVPLAVLLGLRALLALRLCARPAGAVEWLWGETVLAWAFARALFRREVQWRGRRFAVEPGGTMRSLPFADPG